MPWKKSYVLLVLAGLVVEASVRKRGDCQCGYVLALPCLSENEHVVKSQLCDVKYTALLRGIPHLRRQGKSCEKSRQILLLYAILNYFFVV